MKTITILSIDGWHDGSCWQWNNWFTVGTIEPNLLDTLDNNRKLLSYMRDNGYLSEKSKRKVYVSDDGYNFVFCSRANHEPLMAIAYGELLC